MAELIEVTTVDEADDTIIEDIQPKLALLRGPIKTLVERELATDGSRSNVPHGPELDRLLMVDPEVGMTRLRWLGTGPTEASAAAVKTEVRKLTFLRSLASTRSRSASTS
ncbi:MAG: hypothetical protein ACR2GH_00650 [Pseudonocardia sp.]